MRIPANVTGHSGDRDRSNGMGGHDGPEYALGISVPQLLGGEPINLILSDNAV